MLMCALLMTSRIHCLGFAPKYWKGTAQQSTTLRLRLTELSWFLVPTIQPSARGGLRLDWTGNSARYLKGTRGKSKGKSKLNWQIVFYLINLFKNDDFLYEALEWMVLRLYATGESLF